LERAQIPQRDIHADVGQGPRQAADIGQSRQTDLRQRRRRQAKSNRYQEPSHHLSLTFRSHALILSACQNLDQEETA
jgi:hypothetical protein